MKEQQDELYLEIGRKISEIVEQDENYDNKFNILNEEAESIYDELQTTTEQNIDNIKIESGPYDSVEVIAEGEKILGELQSFFYNPENAQDTVCKAHGKPEDGTESQPSGLPEGTLGEFF